MTSPTSHRDLHPTLNFDIDTNEPPARMDRNQITTTISTIVLRSGPIQVVVALLESGNEFHIKVTEITPKLTQLGADIESAVQQQRQHDDMMRKVHDMTTPIDEFVVKAEAILKERRAHPQVLDAMGATLSLVWRDIKELLQQRKSILDMNVNFHEKMGMCRGKMSALEVACRDTMIPIDIETVHDFLDKFKQLRIEMLAAIMSALKIGNGLLARLREMAQRGTLDSRPDHIKQDVKLTLNQVEQWLELLHDRRNMLESAWQIRKTQLEQCLALAILAKDLNELENLLMNKRNDLLSVGFSMADSENTINNIVSEYLSHKQNASAFRDKALRITRATEKLVASGCFAGDEACSKSYSVLNICTEFLELVERREHLLSEAREFYRRAEKALSVLEKLEVEVSNHPTEVTPSVHDRLLKELVEICEKPLQLGYSLLDEIGRSSETDIKGVKRVIEEIENRKIYLEGYCSNQLEEQIKISQAIDGFMEKYNSILSWLVSIPEQFLKINNSIGRNLQTSCEFLSLHHQLLADLEVKGTEINQLLHSVAQVLVSLEEKNRNDITQKVDALQKHWTELKKIAEARVDLVQLFIDFLRSSDHLSVMFERVENVLVNNIPNEAKLLALDKIWSENKAAYIQLKALGKRFVSETAKVADPYLDSEACCATVEEILSGFSSRQFDITNSWDNWTHEIVENRETELLWERTMTENVQSLNAASKLDAQLYPVLTTLSQNPRELKQLVANKLDSVLNEIGRAHSEIEQRIKTTAALKAKDDQTSEKIIQVVNNLEAIKEKLKVVSRDYNELLNQLIVFLENVDQTQITIDNFFNQQSIKLEDDTKCTKFRETIKSQFRSLIEQSEKIIGMVRQQEPENARDHDTDRIISLLEQMRANFEQHYETKVTVVRREQYFGKYNNEVVAIQNNLDDLQRQMDEADRQFGESLASAKATQIAFDYFQQTVALLDKRIQSLKDTAKSASLALPDQAAHINNEVDLLSRRWFDFNKRASAQKDNINQAVQYYTLKDKVDNKYQEHSTYYIGICDEMPLVKTANHANDIINRIDKFITEYEAPQLEDLKTLASLSKNVFDYDRTVTMYSDNITLFQSFFKLKSELNGIVEKIRQNEEQKRRAEEDERRRLQEEERMRLEEAARLQREELEKQRRLEEEEKRRIEEEAAQRRRDEEALRQKQQEEEFKRKQEEEIRKMKEDHERRLKEEREKWQREESERKLLEEQEIRARYEQERLSREELESKKTFVHQILTEIQFDPPQFTQPLCDAAIQEGEKFIFECNVTGNPLPSIEWFKDGISIQNNPDYHTTYANGLCTLSIEETFTEDSAQFTCKASNSVGAATTTATLTVRDPHDSSGGVEMAPYFTKMLVNGIARQGSAFVLNCVVDGHPLPTVQWFRNDVCVDTAKDYAITYNNGEATLKFERVSPEDQAVYTCVATNNSGVAQCSASLNVEFLKPSELPIFDVPLSNIMARVGQKIKLECAVSGSPQPEIIWTHNGKPFGGRDARITNENGRAILVIHQAYPLDAGVYTVIARNAAGEAYSTCNVSVKGRLPNETSDSEMASDMEPIKPSVQLSLRDVCVFEGKRVQLDCVIVGQPEPEVIWYHNNRPVKESSDIQLIFQGDRCSLLIHDACMEDIGEYKVVAINSAGEASSRCILSVTPLDNDNAIKRHHQTMEHRVTTSTMSSHTTNSGPQFNKLLIDILAADGEQIVFECNVTGEPAPLVKWFLNNVELQQNTRIREVKSDDGTHRLFINNVTAADKGLYTVKAANAYGEAKCFSHLIVKSINVSSTDDIIMKTNESASFVCPTFKELFSDKNAYIDESVKFECIVTGKPQPKIRWLFNEQPVHGHNFLPSTSGDRQVLTVAEMSSAAVGRIACVAENSVGKATCVANLNIIDPSNGNLPLATDASRFTEEHQTDSSMVTIQRQMLTTTSSSQVNSVDHFKTIQPGEVLESRHTKEEFNTPLNIHQRIFITKPIEQRVDMPRLTRKNTAPRFITPLIGKIVDQGADVELLAVFDGHPIPAITVQKNGETLGECDNVVVQKSHNKIIIELKRVNVKDAGRYSCVITNEAGSSTSTADVVVKKSVFPPVFGHRLQAQVVKRGTKVVMDIEVSGTPSPDVTWYKDGRPIDQALTSKYEIKRSVNNHTLIIYNVKVEDSGKYMVRAINSGGEAQSIADFAVLEPTPERMVEVVKTVVYEDINNRKDEDKTRQEDKAEFSSHLKSTEASEKGGSTTTEERIYTETCRTTEATMRMEHKLAFDGLELKSTTPTSFAQLKSLGTNTDAVKMESDYTQTTNKSSEANEIISKKAAFDFFSNKIEDKYTKFENVSNGVKIPQQPPQSFVAVEVPIQPLTESTQNHDLKPGSPPVFDYCERQKGQPPVLENMAQRVKHLEELRRDEIDAPPGGIRIWPQTTRNEIETKSSTLKQEFISTVPVFRAPSVTATLPVQTNDLRYRSPSPRPSAEAVEMEKLWAAPKHLHDEVHSYEDTSHQFKQFSSFSDTEYDIRTDSEAEGFSIANRQSTIEETRKMFEDKIQRATNELKSPGIVQKTMSPICIPRPPVTVERTPENIPFLEPGPEPEICFAPRQQYERKQSLVETIKEQTMELQTEPTRHLAGAVRTIPPPPRRDVSEPPSLPPKNISAIAPPLPARAFKEEQFKHVQAPAFHPEPPLTHEVQVENAPDSPSKLKKSLRPVSGYMADTEESFFKQNSTTIEHQQHFEKHYRHFKSDGHPEINGGNENISHESPKDFGKTFATKNISMTSKQHKVTTENQYQQHFTPEPLRVTRTSKPPPATPSPSKFVKGELRESDYESDYDSRIPVVWRPSQADDGDAEPRYKPIRPQFSPCPVRSPCTMTASPAPPTAFDNPPQFDGPPRPKFEPIEKQPTRVEKPSKVEQPVFKPTPITSTPHPIRQYQTQGQQFQSKSFSQSHQVQERTQVQQKIEPQRQYQPPQQYRQHSQSETKYQPQPDREYTTQYYTAIATPPQHNSTIAHETSNTMHMRESNENAQRVVNMTQTRRVIQFDTQRSDQKVIDQQSPLEPFPYSVQYSGTQSPSYRRVPPPPTPTKFVPGQFRESDYESEVDSARIRPLWTPNAAYNFEPQYRRVEPPKGGQRSASVPRSYGTRVQTPMEFDMGPTVDLPKPVPTFIANKNNTFVSQTQTLDRNYGSNKNVSHVMKHTTNQVGSMNDAFKSKARQFFDDLSQDTTKTHSASNSVRRMPQQPSELNKPQGYREESRVSQYGTKHIDPATGLIYFKYDFGYEFGIIFPGDGVKRHVIAGGGPQRAPSKVDTPATLKRHRDISIPVVHEQTAPNQTGLNATVPLNLPPLDVNIDTIHK